MRSGSYRQFLSTPSSSGPPRSADPRADGGGTITGTGSAPPSPGPSRRWIAISTVAIVALLLGATYGLGVWPFSTPPAATTIAPTTFAQAESLAASSATATGGGPWNAYYATSFSTPVSVPVPQEWLYPFVSCPGVAGGVAPNQTETVPVGNGSTVAGTSPFWVVWLLNGAGSLRIYLVDGPSAARIFELDASSTCQRFPVPGSFPPVVNSPVAVAAAWNAGGSAFVAAHPNATLSLFLTGASSSGAIGPNEWVVRWSSCLPTFLGETLYTNASGEALAYYVNATVGDVTGQLPEGPIGCWTAATDPAAWSPPGGTRAIGVGPEI